MLSQGGFISQLHLRLAAFRTLTIYTCVQKFAPIDLFCRPSFDRRKARNFYCISKFGILCRRHLETKLNVSTQLQTFPYRNDIKTASKFQRLLGYVVLSFFVVQQRDRQTDRQTDKKNKNSTFLASGACEVRVPLFFVDT